MIPIPFRFYIPSKVSLVSEEIQTKLQFDEENAINETLASLVQEDFNPPKLDPIERDKQRKRDIIKYTLSFFFGIITVLGLLLLAFSSKIGTLIVVGIIILGTLLGLSFSIALVFIEGKYE